MFLLVNNFKMIGMLLNCMLADEFATFFTTKIDTLRNDLLVKKKALNVLLMRSSLCLPLNFRLLLRWNLMTSGNWLQHCSRSPVSWIHYHLLSSNIVHTHCCLLLLTSSTSLFVKAACQRVWNLQYCNLCSRHLMRTFYNSRTLDLSRIWKRYRRLLRKALLSS